MNNSTLKSEIRGWIKSSQNLNNQIQSNKIDLELKQLIKTQLEAINSSLEAQNGSE